MTPAAPPAVRDLLDRLHAAGVDLYRRGDGIRYRCPPGALTDAFRAEIAAQKPALLAYLAPHPCAACGRHAFPVARLCYWCARGRPMTGHSGPPQGGA